MPGESTIKHYELVIKTLSTKRGITDFEDTKRVMDVLKTKINGEAASKSSIAGQLNAVMWKIGQASPAYKVYRESMVGLNGEIARDKRYETNGKSVSWSELSVLYKEVSDPQDKSILAVYSLVPPRRLMDYSTMIVVENEPEVISQNYYIKGKGKFVFGNYKTIKNYGIQRFDVPPALIKILDKIAVVGHYLFKTSSGGPFDKPHLSAYIGDLTSTYLKGEKRATINTFRHSYITEFLKSNPTTQKRKDVSFMMGHQVGMQLEYDEREDDD